VTRHAVGFQFARPLQRRLAAELDDDAGGLFDMDDFEDVFQRDRLEVRAGPTVS